MSRKVSKGSVFQSIFDFIFLGLGIKILGFVRSIIMAGKFGLSDETDAFYLVLSLIFILSSLIGKTLQQILIPILTQAEEENGIERKQSLFENLLNILAILSAVLCIICYIIAGPLLSLMIDRAASPDLFTIAVKLFRIGIPTIFFYNIASVSRSYLQSEMMFRESSLSLLPVNVFYIIYLLFFEDQFGIYGLMVTQVLGIAFQLVLQAPSMKKLGLRPVFSVDFHDPAIPKILKLIVPILIGIAAADLNTLVDKALAGGLQEGSVSALEYGNQLNLSIRTIFISAVSTVMFPMISRTAQERNNKKLRGQITKTSRYIAFLAIPATVLLIIMGLPIVQALYQRGEFQLAESIMTTSALQFYSIGLLATSMVELLNQVFYALGQIRIPIFNSVLALISNVILNLILIRFMGHAGLALGTSLSALISFAFLYRQLQGIIFFRFTKEDLIYCIKLVITSILAILFMNLIYQNLYAIIVDMALARLISLAISGLLMIPVYLLLLHIFKVEEWGEIVNIVKEKLGKKKA